ncbi:MAG: SufS family cysteine desulfurase [Oscillospiraceae bacterium]|nr:SufS family cysteine desulfurase [Oscillospiraceae bacterium]
MNWNDVRKDFPLLVSDPSLCYLDSSATAQKPCCVLDAMRKYYEESNANPLRGLYDLSQVATDAYEDSREAVRSFINAKSTKEIIFTRNASESLNLAAYCLTERLCPGDEIAITIMEHHSDLIPWQMAAKRSGALLRFIECDEEGLITDEAFDAAVGEKTKIVAMTQVSNVLGVRNDIKKFAEKAHKLGALFVCDGAQSVPHFRVDVQALGVDFLAFSGHKMCGPMGIGVLYGREKLLEEMPPFLTGGEMIEYVTREGATWAELPHKFEAGTVNAGGAVGLAAAIDYYNKIGRENIEAREQYLGNIAFEALKSVPHLNLLGPREASLHNGIFTFTIDGVHPHDIAEIMNADRICIRAGHHCAQPLMKFLNTPSTARVSLMFYNTEEEILRLEESLKTVRGRMGYAE